MANDKRTARDLYRRYLDGEVTFDEVKRETDRAADEYQSNRGQSVQQSPRSAIRPNAQQ